MVMDLPSEFDELESAFTKKCRGTTRNENTKTIPKRGTRNGAGRRVIGLGIAIYLNSRGSLGATIPRYLAEHRNGFNLDKQLGTAEFRLDACGGGQRVESLFLVKCCALLVELRIVAIDIAEITARAHDVFPCNALGGEQCGNVLKNATALSAEVSDVNGSAMLINAGRA